MARKPDVTLLIEPSKDSDQPDVWFRVHLRDGFCVEYRLLLSGVEGFIVAELRVRPLEETGDYFDEESHRWAERGITAGLLKDEAVLGRHVYELLPEFLRDIEQVARRHSGDELDKRVRGRRKRAVITRDALDRTPDDVAAEWARLSLDIVKGFRDWLADLGFDPDRKPHVARRGPKGWPDEEYAELAAAYVERCKAGSPRPAVDVAERYGMTPSALRRALGRARHRGLLTRTIGSRAGGELTPRAKALLRKRRRTKKRSKRKKGGK